MLFLPGISVYWKHLLCSNQGMDTLCLNVNRISHNKICKLEKPKDCVYYHITKKFEFTKPSFLHGCCFYHSINVPKQSQVDCVTLILIRFSVCVYQSQSHKHKWVLLLKQAKFDQAKKQGLCLSGYVSVLSVCVYQYY